MAYRNHLPKRYKAIGVVGRTVFEFESSNRDRCVAWAKKLAAMDGFRSVISYDLVTRGTLREPAYRVNLSEEAKRRFPPRAKREADPRQGRLL